MYRVFPEGRKHMLNLAMLLEDSAREVPERTALVCEGTRLSYAELQAAINQVANGLVQAGISKGDKVALSCQDVPSFVIAYYGILKAGAAITEVELVAWSKQNMADYKYPRLIEFRTELPMTATGKVLKSEPRS
jgi:acyl-CoA synthetase (AMP-forming)/AMP-acid ligase II